MAFSRFTLYNKSLFLQSTLKFTAASSSCSNNISSSISNNHSFVSNKYNKYNINIIPRFFSRHFGASAGKVLVGKEATKITGKVKRRHRSRSLRSLKAPMYLTDEAVLRIKKLLQNKEDAIGVRVGVKTRGCNGLSYTLNYATDRYVYM